MEYLVDGHNLIGQGLIPGIHLDQEDDEERLVRWLRARQPHLKAKITVVFDGGIPAGTSLALTGGGVTAVFAARYRNKADHVILSRVRQATRPSHITVVTNDWELRQALNPLGVNVIPGAAFIRLLQRRPTSSPGSSDQKLKPRMSKREVDEWLQLFGASGNEDEAA